MFEGWLHETLANSLGRILDISKEQLRISLWSGARSVPRLGAYNGAPLIHRRARRNPATARRCRRHCHDRAANLTSTLLSPAAWRTGLTLENVLLRLDAFEHLQLPVELLHGSIGRIQAQVHLCRRRGVALVATLASVVCTEHCMCLLLHPLLPAIRG